MQQDLKLSTNRLLCVVVVVEQGSKESMVSSGGEITTENGQNVSVVTGVPS